MYLSFREILKHVNGTAIRPQSSSTFGETSQSALPHLFGFLDFHIEQINRP